MTPISIVTGKLIPTVATKVSKAYSKESIQIFERLEKNLKSAQSDFEASQDKATNGIFKGLLERAQKAMDDFYANTQQVVTTVREYVDSKGAKYIETIEDAGPRNVSRRLEKYEEEFLKDGRKIETKTIHDKSDFMLMGEGHQDGLIETIETFKTKDGVAVGRRTTKRQASGYGGKTVEKEVSVDGQELGEYNTKTTYTDFWPNGVRFSRRTSEPGIQNRCSRESQNVDCNEKGIPQIIEDAFKPGW